MSVENEMVIETTDLTKQYGEVVAVEARQTMRAPRAALAAGGNLPDQTHAIIVLAVYTLAFGGVAFWLFERRDVQGATGGG